MKFMYYSTYKTNYFMQLYSAIRIYTNKLRKIFVYILASLVCTLAGCGERHEPVHDRPVACGWDRVLRCYSCAHYRKGEIYYHCVQED